MGISVAIFGTENFIDWNMLIILILHVFDVHAVFFQFDMNTILSLSFQDSCLHFREVLCSFGQQYRPITNFSFFIGRAISPLIIFTFLTIVILPVEFVAEFFQKPNRNPNPNFFWALPHLTLKTFVDEGNIYLCRVLCF